MSMYHSFLYVAFLISFAQCQTTLNQAEISKLLQMIQNQPASQTGPQMNNVDTAQLIRKLMASAQGGNRFQQTNSQPQAPMAPPPNNNPTTSNLLLPLAVTGAIDNPLTALAATSMTGNQRTGSPNLNNYLTAKVFDFNDAATSMMLFNGLNGGQPQQPTPTPTPQPPVNSGTPQPPRQQTNGGLFGHSPMGNYFTARAFDFPDMYTNMMLFNGVSGRQPSQQPMGTRNQAQSTFDPTLFYLTAF